MKIFLVLLILLLAYVAYEAVRFVIVVYREIPVVSPYEQSPGQPSMRVLVVGDSTAVGTGADNSADSVAGRFGSEHPDAEIVNRGKNGARAADVLGMFKEGDQFDLVLVQVGGNDILRFTSLAKLERHIRSVLERAQVVGDRVVFMSTGNVGSAPAFGPVLSLVYEKRTRAARELFMRISEEMGVTYIDLFLERDNDPFVAEPARYHAPDGIHPSSAGYGAWYAKLKGQGGV